jgi:mRNA interferase MazF
MAVPRIFPRPNRGEIWDVDWTPGRGSEQAGTRPALIIQNDIGNHSPAYPNVIVAAISTRGRNIPFHVQILPSSESGLKEISYIKCEQILTISKVRLAGKKPRGKVSDDILDKVGIALKLSLDLES